MGNKFGEADDAAYVDKLVGKVLVQACAAVTLARPMDPVEFFSEWLHKYCDNACILKDNAREKARKFNKENELEYELNRKANADALRRTEQQACVNHMKTITDDPYLLWDTCLKSVCAFTGSEAAYVAVVINKIWEPKPEKKKAEGEEGEEGEEEEEPAEEEVEEGEEGEDKMLGSDDSSVDNDDEVEEKDEPEEDAEGEEEGEQEPEPEEEEEEGEEGKEKKTEGESTEDAAPKPPKPPKPPRPLNYKRKKLLYVAATRPSNRHMLNRQLDIKKGPVTFTVLLEGLPELHIPNALYKEGVHFFGGIPRVGAYFVVPISVEFTAKKYLKEEYKDRPPEWFAQVHQKQVIALLCVDTLKTEHIGTGKAFEPIETEFMAACGAAMSTALDMNNKEILKEQNAGVVIEKYKEKLKEIKVARKAQLDQEKADAIATKKAKEKEGRRKRFEEAHKAWTERQTAKAEAKKKKDEEIKAKKKAGEEVEEEEAEEEEEDPEPVPEEEPPEEGEGDEEEAPAEEAAEEATEGDEDVEGEEKPVDPGIDDAELEPNPLEGIEKPKGEGDEEGEEEKEAGEREEEEPDEEEPEEEEEPESPEDEEGAADTVEARATEEGVEKVVESEDVKKLKAKKAENAKKAKEMKKQIKDLKNLLKGFDKGKEKTTLDLEKVAKEAEKYEKALQIADGVVKYLKLLMGNVYSLLVENKDAELKRIKRWLYPNRHVHRVLKAMLYLLGHKKLAIDDWISARKLFNQDLISIVLKEYDPLKAPDPAMWKSADSYFAGIKEAKLTEQAPIGFLLQQWILACKKVTAAGVTYHKIKSKFTEISKEFAEKELAKIICEVETQLATEKLTKMVADEEVRLAKAKAAEETEEKRLADIAAAELAAKEAADATAAVAAEAAAEAAAAAGEEAPAEET